MQTINFQPLGFEGIPQREAEARQRWGQAWSGMARNLGKMGQDAFDAKAKVDEAKKAEEWRQKQWNHQRWQEEDERKRREEQERLDRESADRLRNEFMSKYGNRDLSRYGLPAQFAMDRIKNARDWQSVVSGGDALTHAIQYQDMLDAQRDERAAREQEELDEQAGANLYGDIANRMSMSGINLSNIGELWRGTLTPEDRQGRLDEMLGYRQQLLNFMSNPVNARRVTPEMRRQLDDLNSAIFNWRTRMAPRTKVRF